MTLDELYKQGAIKLLHDRGLLDSGVLRYFKYHEAYTKHRNDGKRYTDAIILTSIQYNVSEKTIKRAVRALS